MACDFYDEKACEAGCLCFPLLLWWRAPLPGPCPLREHGQLSLEPQESCPCPGVLMGRGNHTALLGNTGDIRQASWTNQRWCLRKSRTPPALQEYPPKQCRRKLRLKKEACRDGSFHGKLSSPWDVDFFNLKEQLFLKNVDLKKPSHCPGASAWVSGKHLGLVTLQKLMGKVGRGVCGHS